MDSKNGQSKLVASVIESLKGSAHQTAAAKKSDALRKVKDELKQVARDLVAAIEDDRLDEAQQMYEILSKFLPEQDLLTYRVLITIQRDGALEALHLLNDMPEDAAPELKAICLKLLHDPLWHSMAESLNESSPDPAIRNAMGEMLRPEVESHMQH